MESRSRVVVALAFVLALAVTGALAVTLVPSGPTLATTWVSDPPDGAGGNHHGPAVGVVDGRAMVFAPISGTSVGPACGLVALDAATGDADWRYQVAPDRCTVHAVADPTFTERDGEAVLLVATTENALFSLDPASGDVRERYELSSYGYAPPTVVDLTPDPGEEILVVDAGGTVQVITAAGEVAWRRSTGAGVSTSPVVGDVSGSGEAQLAFGTSDGRLLVLDASGDTTIQLEAPFDGAITWLTSDQLDDDPATELVAATAAGRVVAVDGATGTVQWTQQFDTLAAVGAVGDGTGDGVSDVYATAADGVVRLLDGRTGEPEWEVAVANREVQMMAPPSLGDVTGDGVEELVVASNDGRVVVLQASSGRQIADAERDDVLFARPVLADVDGDGRLEVFVIYADGAVVRYDYEA